MTSQSFCGSSQYLHGLFRDDARPAVRDVRHLGGRRGDGGRHGGGQGDGKPGIGAYVSYPAAAAPFAVTARIGISFVDVAGARNNLAREVGGRRL